VAHGTKSTDARGQRREQIRTQSISGRGDDDGRPPRWAVIFPIFGIGCLKGLESGLHPRVRRSTIAKVVLAAAACVGWRRGGRG
jgi:hypothetical protein